MSGLVLASGSASRRQILEGAGIAFETQRPRVDEEALKPGFAGKSPAELALCLARAKAASIEAPGQIVLGADQVLEFEGRSFDKPKDRAELHERLEAMAGRTHFLRGGAVLMRGGAVLAEITDSAALTMRNLTPDEIKAYLDAVPAEVLNTVGGYMLEGEGARLFEKVEGDFFSILGLPLFPVLDVLRRERAIAF
jgi:septum formation protein